MYHVVQIIQSYDVISKRPLGCQSGHMIGSFAPVPRVLSTQDVTQQNLFILRYFRQSQMKK